MPAEPTTQHAWLKQLVGDWAYTSECPMGPDGEVLTADGNESVRMLGDLWMVGESTGLMPGGKPMTAIMTIGFDPEKQRFVGTWVGSPMASMFVYEGTLDEDARTLTLNTTGADCTDPGKQADYQDIIVLTDSGRELRSRMRTPDGEWMDIMRAVYTRTS